MPKQLLVIQHTPWEGPGRFLLKAARNHGVRLHTVKVYQQAIPDGLNHDGLIVLGGSPNVDEERQYPFLTKEKEFIRKSIAADIPYLGFCLGHQLLADALGARVGPNFRTSIGFVEGHITHEGKDHPIFRGLPTPLPLFKWHGQAALPPLPRHITILATSEECQVEAISVEGRPHIVGVQFDNHAADPRDLNTWTKKDKWLASLEKQGINIISKIAKVRESAALLEEQFTIFFQNFLLLTD